ncbi:MAG: imidazolonepropionase, partial [Pseudomonadota bacterium]
MEKWHYRNATLATMRGDGYGLIQGGSVLTLGDRIVFVGRDAEVPTSGDARVVDVGGRLITPALVDCHTHLVYAGSRADEFEQRLNGMSYAEIAAGGGGINATVQATRLADDDTLREAALKRVDRLIAEGVATIEIKSGYGLDRDTELKILRVARSIEQHRSVRIFTTFLGAHAVPHGMDADSFVDNVVIRTLRHAHAHGLVDMVDGFLEHIAFAPAQIRRVFDVARELNLPIRVHAGQLSDLGGASLAAAFGALSVDHLEYTNESDIAAMSAAGCVAVLLPGAYYTLRETQTPPVDHLRQHGVPIALATDSNPGSSPMTSLLLTMNMGAVLFGLTPAECLRAVTVNANRALGIADAGRLARDQRADMAIWAVDHPSELTYRMGD